MPKGVIGAAVDTSVKTVVDLCESNDEDKLNFHRQLHEGGTWRGSSAAIGEVVLYKDPGPL